jgi:hypothetical protein
MTTKKPFPQLPTDELLTQFLAFCRGHFAEHSSVIMIGDNATDDPDFQVTPVQKQNKQ